MPYGIQVLVRNTNNNVDEWRWLHPTGAPRYEWPTIEEAQRMRDMCYPDEPRSKVRVADTSQYP